MLSSRRFPRRHLAFAFPTSFLVEAAFATSCGRRWGKRCSAARTNVTRFTHVGLLDYVIVEAFRRLDQALSELVVLQLSVQPSLRGIPGFLVTGILISLQVCEVGSSTQPRMTVIPREVEMLGRFISSAVPLAGVPRLSDTEPFSERMLLGTVSVRTQIIDTSSCILRMLS